MPETPPPTTTVERASRPGPPDTIRHDAAHHPYLDRMSPAAREAFLALSDDTSLWAEIRLSRTILTVLSEDPETNHRGMAQVLTVLVRMIAAEVKQLANRQDV